MFIGELARSVGISTKTIRYYETLGLLGPPRRSESGYRVYGDADVDRVRFVLGAKSLGLSLSQIQEIMKIWDEGGDVCHRVGALLDDKLQDLERRIGELTEFRDRLRAYKLEMDRQARKAGVVCRHVEGVQEGRWDPETDSLPDPADWRAPGASRRRKGKGKGRGTKGEGPGHSCGSG